MTTTVEVRATDTGGNSTVSAPLTLELVPDSFPPEIRRSSPIDGSKVVRDFNAVRIGFNEALDAATVTPDAFELRDSSGAVVNPIGVQLRRDDHEVRLTLPGLETREYTVVVKAGRVADRSGNLIDTEQVVTAFTVTDATTSWASPESGFWDDKDNWRNGKVPTADDLVLIDTPGDITVTHRQDDTKVIGIISNETFMLNGGSMEVTSSIGGEGTYRFTGGTINGTLVNEGALLVQTQDAIVNGSLQNMASGTLKVEANPITGHALLTVANGFTNEGLLELTATDDSNNNNWNAHLVVSEGKLTNVAGGTIVSSTGGGRPTSVRRLFGEFDNQGTVNVEHVLTIEKASTQHVNAGTINVTGGNLVLSGADASFTNDGTLKVGNGRAVSLNRFLQSSSGVVDLEIAGVNSLGRLTTSGEATLDGTLRTTFVGGFVPNVGDGFEVLTYDRKNGKFFSIGDGVVAFVETDNIGSLVITVSSVW